ncbi:MAG: hypothetical protein HQL71_06510 [Magnetococcales bacterium]|nr:hypothetical protein [Magnetococcales bacterium]
MAKSRKKTFYTAGFKTSSIQLVIGSDQAVNQIAVDLGIQEGWLYLAVFIDLYSR